MSKNEMARIQLTDNHDQVNDASDNRVTPLRNGTQLEQRITPLVVIAIIAVLIGLLLPAVQAAREAAPSTTAPSRTY